MSPSPASGSGTSAAADAGAARDVAGRPLRIALCSPVPPAPSGIADYVEGLLPLLPEAWEIEVFTDVEPSPASVADRAPCRSRSSWAPDDDDRFDLVVHQVGNDAALVDAMLDVRRRPGLLVLHDPVLHPARAGAAIGGGRLQGYREALRRGRPDVAGALGHLVAGGLAGPSIFWRFPLCEDLVRGSLHTVVHGELTAAWLRALIPEASVGTVTHWHPVRVPDAGAVEEWRRRLGATDRVPLLATFGHIGAAHRLDVVLEALAGLVDRREFRLAVVGRVDERLELPAVARRLGLDDRIEWLGRVDDADFGALMAAADVAFNLRYPTARASSGTLQQLLQLGTPLVLTDLLHLREIPDAAVRRLPASRPEAEAEALRDALLPWLEDPDRRAAASAAARAWAAREITPERMADSYVAAVARALA